jgi:hypothetical protein
MVKALDAAWLRLRAQMKAGALPELSKSILVDLALEVMLEDLEAAGMDAQVIRKLVDQDTRRP